MNFSLNAFTYKWLIDPLLSGGQKKIIKALDTGDKVIDIACGTGALSMAMAKVASAVKGIDLSDDMIEFAKETSRKRNISNVSFSPHDASDLSAISDNEFNVAVTSMAIHQFGSGLAVQIIKEMKRIAERIIIMDYNYPIPGGFTHFAVFSIEGIAGGDHYRNFKEYNRLGGLDYFLKASGLSLEAELYNSTAFRVIECK